MVKPSLYDTICAIATPPGEGGIAVIRISGQDSFNIINKIFFRNIQRKDSQVITNDDANKIIYGFIFDNEKLIDEVLISVFKSPNSFTGEDIIEISCHGGFFIANKIITLLNKLNIRIAEPGEFSKRAFLNGKIDLSQAEAIADLITSKTDASHNASLAQLEGSLSKYVKSVREEIIKITSLVELELDFAEEDVEFVNKNEVKQKILSVISELNRIIISYIKGKIIKNGVNLVIAGKPNSGKSSLFNYFLNSDRAIVSNVAGTTRDFIEENLLINGVLFKLTDTAGIRLSDDQIETEGIKRSLERIKNADLVLYLIDSSASEKDLIDSLKYFDKNLDKNKTIPVFSKSDLENNSSIDLNAFNNNFLKISINDDKSIDNLKSEMINKLNLTSIPSQSGELIITNLRHKLCLENTVKELESAIQSIENNMSGEYISLDLRNALNKLAEITGEFTNDDILNSIFLNFCIGK